MLISLNLVIGAVLIPGAKALRLVKEEMVKTMKPGSVIVDVAVDQGGAWREAGQLPMTMVFIRHGMIYYCAANMPGGVARTSTFALNNATLPYVLKNSRCRGDSKTDKGHFASKGG